MSHKTSLKKYFLTIVCCLFLAACGGGAGSDKTQKTPEIIDTTPDSINIDKIVDAELNSDIYSDVLTVTGINTETDISVIGGQYSINNQSFIDTPSTVESNQTITLKLRSSEQAFTEKSMQLAIGDKSFSFTVTTKHNTTPKNLVLNNKADVDPEQWIESDPITITGITKPISIAIDGGEYAIDSGNFSAESSTINNEQLLTVRVKSSPFSLTKAQTTITLNDTLTYNFAVSTKNSAQAIVANKSAFSAIRKDGSVATWGDPRSGGDSSNVQQYLQNVSKIYAHHDGSGFAALREDNSVVIWGYKNFTGLELPKEPIANVKDVIVNPLGVTLLKQDNTAITYSTNTSFYGEPVLTINEINQQLVNIEHIYTTDFVFAALKKDKTLLIWGEPAFSIEPFVNITQVITSNAGLIITDEDNNSRFLGYKDSLDDYSVLDDLKQPMKLFRKGLLSPITVISETGEVTTAGRASEGGDSSSVQDKLHDIDYIVDSGSALTAFTKQKTAFSWGRFSYQSEYFNVTDKLIDLKKVIGDSGMFAALTQDGNVIMWGEIVPIHHHKLLALITAAEKLANIKDIFVENGVFWALDNNNRAYSWGLFSELNSDTQDKEIARLAFSNNNNFAAITTSGEFIIGGAQSNYIQDNISQPVSMQHISSSTVMLTDKGKLHAIRGPSLPKKIRELNNVVSFGYYDHAILAVLATGNVYYERLPDSDEPTEGFSTFVASLTDVKKVVSSTYDGIVFIHQDGSVSHWLKHTINNYYPEHEIAAINNALQKVNDIFYFEQEFYALTADNKLVKFGGLYSVQVYEDIAEVYGQRHAGVVALNTNKQVQSIKTATIPASLSERDDFESVTYTTRGFIATTLEGQNFAFGSSLYDDQFQYINDIPTAVITAFTIPSFDTLILTDNKELFQVNESGQTLKHTDIKELIYLWQHRHYAYLTSNNVLSVLWLNDNGEEQVIKQISNVANVWVLEYSILIEKTDGAFISWGDLDTMHAIDLSITQPTGN
ncbi:hypothetical protein [Thalassomonas sp. M1454]|uniref:hypothetical protein n=1 Tax=Thalassomonas sp. M1454 TaxID=2594477 RepID=UPI00117F076C|nr:hypothetical protein [Thalassomonas sp. M1454]TRX54930.1 hypothetical protein FNN08_10015 [Thalassomonas sp. M1454]